ncbi:unnamed protein product [Pleuronectes platessa]|uniref:Uncharacterized protein n=1 Tax=Pleuronectes platessa TaxID=8262 RepID=A0A9N7VR60_PLEPL|nr:unnamed protein product [Pleuronectes platessa]
MSRLCLLHHASPELSGHFWAVVHKSTLNDESDPNLRFKTGCMVVVTCWVLSESSSSRAANPFLFSPFFSNMTSSFTLFHCHVATVQRGGGRDTWIQLASTQNGSPSRIARAKVHGHVMTMMMMMMWHGLIEELEPSDFLPTDEVIGLSGPMAGHGGEREGGGMKSGTCSGGRGVDTAGPELLRGCGEGEHLVRSARGCSPGPDPYILPPGQRPSLQTSRTNKEPYSYAHERPYTGTHREATL